MNSIEARVQNKEFSIEFVVDSVAELTPAILDDCVANGATKVASIFDPELVCKLADKITGHAFMRWRFPELRALGRYIKSELGTSGRVTPVVDAEPITVFLQASI